MTDPDELLELTARAAALRAEIDRLRAVSPRRSPAPAAARLGAFLAVAVLATWVVAQDVLFKTDDAGTGDVVRFRIEPNGAPTGTPARAYFLNSYLGVGTSANLARLDVTGTSAEGIRYRRTGSADARIQVGDPTKTWSLAAGSAAAGDFSIVEETGGAGTGRLHVKQGGAVGIGTSNPSQKLEVAGNLVASGTGAGQIRLGNVGPPLPGSVGPGALVYRTSDTSLYGDIAGVWTPIMGGGSGVFPRGVIAIWSGSVASIPAGWVLCNGVNVVNGIPTPDLRDRFVAGSGATYPADTTGGSSGTHTHSADVGNTASTTVTPTHAHTFDFGATAPGSSAAGAHSHWVDLPGTWSGGGGGWHGHGGGNLYYSRTFGAFGGGGGNQYYLTSSGGNPYFWYRPLNAGGGTEWGGGTGGAGGGHSHVFDFPGGWSGGVNTTHIHWTTFNPPATASNSTAVAHAHDTDPAAVASTAVSNLPLYYALCYIMKD